jgi:prepilin-type N-terminal cleavage/methylation domain-containing protein
MTLVQGTPSPRRGFTLIELLVVIGIISVLAALTLGAAFRVIDSQNASNTETVLQQVNKVLQQQYRKVAEQAQKETISPSTHAQLWTLAGQGVDNDQGRINRRAQVIYVKMRLMEEFPQTYAEVYNQPTTTGVYTNQKSPYLTTLTQLFGAKAPAAKASESAAMLLLSIQRQHSGISFSADSLPSTNVADTDNDGLKEILDGWGNPVVFFRFPTGNPDLDASNPAPTGSKAAKFRDPDDPDGLLQTPVWVKSAQLTKFEAICHKVSNTYMVPVIVSMGNNGKLGLDVGGLRTMAVTNAGDANDNVYSYRLRLGSTGQ